jgi:hypothetical protein
MGKSKHLPKKKPSKCAMSNLEWAQMMKAPVTLSRLSRY